MGSWEQLVVLMVENEGSVSHVHSRKHRAERMEESDTQWGKLPLPHCGEPVQPQSLGSCFFYWSLKASQELARLEGLSAGSSLKSCRPCFCWPYHTHQHLLRQPGWSPVGGRVQGCRRVMGSSIQVYKALEGASQRTVYFNVELPS